MLEANEAILMTENHSSLMSTFQVREFGHTIDDVARRHGGTQSIEADGITIPLAIKKGLFTMKVRPPTAEEKDDCLRIVLTSDQIWEPDQFNDDDDAIVCADLNKTSVTTSVENEEFSYAHIVDNDMSDVSPYLERVTSANTNQTQVAPVNYKKYQAKLGWLPLNVIKKTFLNTTNLAKKILRLPLRRHFKSRFPQLNRNRLQETYSTDTFFSSVDGIGGVSCTQIFCGEKSLFTKAYAMTTESQGPTMLEQFIAEVGAPYRMHSDNSQMQTSDAWRSILRKYNIEFSTTEPKHPHQNRS